MKISLSLFLRFFALCTNTAFLAVSLVLFMWGVLVPFSEFMNSINAWPDTWVSDSYIPMTAMGNVEYTLKATMLAIAFYTVGDKIETWSKRLPSLEDAALKAHG